MAQVGINSNGFVLNIGTTIDQGQINKCKTQLDKFRAEAEKNGKINITINYDKARGVKTQIEQIKTATGEYATVVSKLNSQGQVLEQVITRVGRSANNATNSIDNLNKAQQNLNTSTKHSISVFKDFTNTFLKMAKFNTINLIYDGIINKTSEAIQITNDFDAAMTEFKKVTDTSNLSLSDYTNTLGEYGEAVARTQTQMLEAATEFSKSGYNAETSAQLAQVASLFQNIADSEISASDAASFIISQMKAFGIEASQATSILDKVNETSNSFSVSSTDITSALTKQSASLAAYGNTLDESIALT